MANRGPKPKMGQSETVQVTLPKDQHDYLAHLATMSRLGTKPNEVAAHILIRELDKMLISDYHKKKIANE